MNTTTEKIKSIVQKRKQRLPQIQTQRTHLLQVLEELDELDGLLSQIRREKDTQQGDYFVLMKDNPQMAQALDAVSTSDVRILIKEQLKKLDILEKRFGRDTIRIAMIGFERQGKSTFLKAISGLKSDKVIPAYDGSSCTGAVSVIHNIEGPFRVEVQMYSLQEFLDIVNEKLGRFFPNRTFYINNVSELQRLDLSGYSSNDITLNTEFAKFKNAYCEHVSEYSHLLGQPIMTLTDEDEVAKYVAQYERFDTPPESGYDEEVLPEEEGDTVKYQRNYYRYVAVKHVNIYKQFDSIDSRLIELVDTVGLGDASNADKIEAEMFRVLREDCDAAVDLFKPDALGGGFNTVQQDILKKIRKELEGREPQKWMVYVINKVGTGKGCNISKVNGVLKQFEETAAYGGKPVAWAKIIDGSNVIDVQQNLVTPLLQLITDNLGDLDSNLMKEAKEQGSLLFGTLSSLRDKMEKVISGSAKKGTQEGALFDIKIGELTDGLFPALRKLDEEIYEENRNKPCPEIIQAIDSVIEGLYDVVPDEKEILKPVNLGASRPSEIFADFCKVFYNDIFEEFENVSDDIIVPLREKVKMDMIDVMFNDGLLGRIPLAGYNIQDGPSLEWLECLLREKVDKEAYPSFYEALSYICSYHFNIEDTIEYEVSQCIGVIDLLNDEEFIPYKGANGGSVEERAKAIWQELHDRVPRLRDKLLDRCHNFAQIPSHSFSTRVKKFRFKIVWGRELNSDMREFYRDYCYTIWKEFSQIEGKTAAFGKWNGLCQGIAELCQMDKFILSA